MDDLELPANLLRGCVEVGGLLCCDGRHLLFTPGAGDEAETDVPYATITGMRLGGRRGQDSNRLDLTTSDGRNLTFLIVGRERVTELVMDRQGWTRRKG